MTARPQSPLHPDCSPGSHWQERLVLPGVELYLGDCAEILPLLTFGAVVTDPPYGVGFVSGMNKVKGAIMGDETPPDVRWMANYPAVVWGGNNFCDQLPSQKPEFFQDMIESQSDGPRLELFARRKRLGWAAWGNEVASDITLSPLNAIAVARQPGANVDNTNHL